MQTYEILDAAKHVIGLIYAANGDLAWMLAKLLDPRAAQLRPHDG
jgi:hypothetical protein